MIWAILGGIIVLGIIADILRKNAAQQQRVADEARATGARVNSYADYLKRTAGAEERWSRMTDNEVREAVDAAVRDYKKKLNSVNTTAAVVGFIAVALGIGFAISSGEVSVGAIVGVGGVALASYLYRQNIAKLNDHYKASGLDPERLKVEVS